MRVTINQPLPFAPVHLFNRILNSDLNVNLGSAQYIRRTNHSHYEIMVQGHLHKLIIPIKHVGRQEVSLNDSAIDYSHNWVKSHTTTIRQSYSKAPFFQDVFENVVEPILNLRMPLLGSWSWLSMLQVFNYLNAPPAWKQDAELWGIIWDNPSLWMLTLAERTRATEYFCGKWAIENYLRVETFQAKGIEVVGQDWTQPVYDQGVFKFIPNLSILDVLFRYGRGAIDFIK